MPRTGYSGDDGGDNGGDGDDGAADVMMMMMMLVMLMRGECQTSSFWQTAWQLLAEGMQRMQRTWRMKRMQKIQRMQRVWWQALRSCWGQWRENRWWCKFGLDRWARGAQVKQQQQPMWTCRRTAKAITAYGSGSGWIGKQAAEASEVGKGTGHVWTCV
jgi:hypothetical protein